MQNILGSYRRDQQYICNAQTCPYHPKFCHIQRTTSLLDPAAEPAPSQLDLFYNPVMNL